MLNFSKKVVVITGASSGIGEATAILLAELGAKLVLVARNLENLQRVATECHMPHGKHPLIISADITKENDVIRIEKEVINYYGRIDALLNIAGSLIPETILQPDVQKFDQNILLNLRSVYLTMSYFAPHLSETKGNIVNVSSIASNIMIKGHCSYNVSKAGVECITKYAAAELAEKGVRVNCVQPGTTRTRVLENLNFSKEEADKMFDEIAKRIPLGKVIEPREVAQAIAFLASDLAKNVTGVIFGVDGGQILAGAWAAEIH